MYAKLSLYTSFSNSISTHTHTQTYKTKRDNFIEIYFFHIGAGRKGIKSIASTKHHVCTFFASRILWTRTHKHTHIEKALNLPIYSCNVLVRLILLCVCCCCALFQQYPISCTSDRLPKYSYDGAAATKHILFWHVIWLIKNGFSPITISCYVCRAFKRTQKKYKLGEWFLRRAASCAASASFRLNHIYVFIYSLAKSDTNKMILLDLFVGNLFVFIVILNLGMHPQSVL